jgi:hypothetical protein
MANDHLQQDSDELGIEELAALAMAGGAFDDLAAESDLYSFSDGDEIGAG